MESLGSQFSSYDSFEQARMNSYLNNMLQFDGNYPDGDDEMASEQKRLETYEGWPESSPIKPLDLARAGFYYTGSGDQVRCFSCDLQLGQWKEGDIPLVEHKRRNITCDFLQENERERFGIACNPEPASIEHGIRTGSLATTLGENKRNPIYKHNQPRETPPYNYPTIGREPVHHTGYFGYSNQQVQQPSQRQPQRPSTLPLFPNSIPYSNSQYITTSPGVFITSQYPHSNRPVLQTPEDFTASPTMVATTHEVPRQPSSIRTPAIGNQGMREIGGSYQERMPQPINRHAIRNGDIPVLSPVLQHVPNVHVRPENVHHTALQTDLQSSHHRLATFIDWPEDCPVRPWELASAGFFYKGTGDTVMCYKCKVTLRNWEPEDTPWGEHKRWSPDCPLVKGHEQGGHIRTPVEDLETTTEVQQQHQRVPHVMSGNMSPMPRQEHYQPSMILQQQQQQHSQHHVFPQRANTVPKLPIENQSNYNHAWGKAETAQNYPMNPSSPPQSTGRRTCDSPVHSALQRTSSNSTYYPATCNTSYQSSEGVTSYTPSNTQFGNQSAVQSYMYTSSQNAFDQKRPGNQSAMQQFTSTENSIDQTWPPSQSTMHHTNATQSAINNQRWFGILSGMQHSNAAKSAPVPSSETTMLHNSQVQSLNDRDLATALEMGFSREAIDNAVARHTERTGQGFDNLDDLMHALLDEGQTSSRSSPSSTSTNRSPSNLQSENHNTSSSSEMISSQLPFVQSFSFDHTSNMSKRALKRSNSAPPLASTIGNPSEQASRDLENTQEERLTCKICMDAEVGVVFLPCGHISCCPHCASGLDLCPMCRKPIQQVVRTFLS